MYAHTITQHSHGSPQDTATADRRTTAFQKMESGESAIQFLSTEAALHVYIYIYIYIYSHMYMCIYIYIHICPIAIAIMMIMVMMTFMMNDR